MPDHQNAFLRYPYPSPATSLYLSLALSSPTFFSTNDVPINAPEPIARHIPMILKTGGRSCFAGDSAPLVPFVSLRAYISLAATRRCPT